MTVALNKPALTYPYDAAPEPGSLREVAPGVHWLCMKLPFALTHINLWLLADGTKDKQTGWTIVDTGIANDDIKQNWERIFSERLDGLPVTRLICTHFHGDHMGLAGWLTERWNIELWMTAGEYYMARANYAIESEENVAARVAFYKSHGVSREALGVMGEPNRAFQRLITPVPRAFRKISGGEPVEIAGRAWFPIIGRGHAPEHACLWCPDLNVVIGGDILLPRISPNVSVRADEPFSNPLREYLDSLGGFTHVPADALILPAHGLPYRGLHARIADLHAHHASRLEALREFLEPPRAAVDCFPILFRREIEPGLSTAFATGEAIAHLHYLEKQGLARRERGADGLWRFARA
jgi:glyoxylase-like metal-dependent hydrolase (beta-lactamase superfamily II)